MVYDLIDTDNDGSITKPEMEIFLKAMVLLHDDLTFAAESHDKYIERK